MHIDKMNPNFIFLCAKIVRFTILRDIFRLILSENGQERGAKDYATHEKI